jgi:hypothetical protein
LSCLFFFRHFFEDLLRFFDDNLFVNLLKLCLDRLLNLKPVS